MKLVNKILYGVFTAIALIAYFLLMKLFGLEEFTVLRVFNFVIISGGIFFLFRKMFVRTQNNDFAYFDGLLAGITLTVVSVVIFVAFMAFYILVLDQNFGDVIQNQGMFGNGISISIALVALLIEGIISGAVMSFVLMQYFKKETVKRDIPERKDKSGYTP